MAKYFPTMESLDLISRIVDGMFNFENQKLFVHCHFMGKRNLNPHTEFDFFLCLISMFSNEMLMKNGFKEPKAIKTGTTIVGIIFKDGVVLGADTRATEGPIVADKNCEKIHFLAKNM